MKRALWIMLVLLPLVNCAQELSRVKITILSTMMADLKGVGEWGFSALVETDSNRILFDTGLKPGTVLNNATELKLGLSNVPWVVLSHNHTDHTGGLLSLHAAYKDSNSFSRIFTAPGFFLRQQIPVGLKKSPDSILLTKDRAVFETITSFKAIAPGIYLTGPTPRKYDEKNYPAGKTLTTAQGVVEDNVPEDMSMVLVVPEGLVVLSGCGHAGIVNTVAAARTRFPGKKVIAVIGGFHLLDTPEDKVRWTANELKDAGIRYFVGAHCTGLNALYQLREIMHLPKEQCVVGTVGMTYEYGKGIAGGWMK